MSLNVNRNVNDQFYRYKMPKLIAKIEGKGNGIKTVIVNMVDVAKSLSRPPTYPTKYFGCELGAQTQLDLKNERFIVNGSHDSTKLQELLHQFIAKYVLCPNCENPETSLNVHAKAQTIKQRCMACGYQGMLDLRHRLTTYILRNPPGSEQEGGTTPSKKDKKAKRKDKDSRSSPEANGHHDNKEEEEKTDAPTVNNNHKEEEADDDDWGDIDESAVKSRMTDLSSAAQKLAMDDDIEKTSEERMEIFYNFVTKRKGEGDIANADKAILSEADRLEVKDKATMVLVELLLSEKVLTEVKEYRKIFLRFTHENPKAQRYLLHGLEQLTGVKYNSTLLPKVPHILKAFYDLDIVEEDVILDWVTKVSKRYVPKAVSQEIRNKAAPFINWLKEAEEEEDSESEEEDEGEDGVEVVYSKDARQIETKTIKQNAPVKQQPEEPAEEDDFDIDAI